MKQLILFLFFTISCASQNKQNEIKLFVFDCGENTVKDISLFSPGHDRGVKKTLVASCYLIKHPKGFFMWDTGLSDKLIKTPKGIKVKGGAFTLKVKKTLISQLQEIGVSPQSVQYLAFSHMHPDHTGNANLFSKSIIFIQNEEYDAAFGPSPEKYSFDNKTYNKLDKKSFKKISGDYDVFGDGSVVIKKAPGHTPGHQVLYVNLPETGAILLSGDLFHFEKNRKFKRIPAFNYNKRMTMESINNIENFVLKSGAKVWIQHDPDQRKLVKLSPKFYQ